MKPIMAFAVLSLLATAAPLSAGVIITQDVVTDTPNGPMTSHHTIMIQGNKQKTDMHGQTMLLNLDDNTMVLLNPERKKYLKLPFPPSGMASAMENMSALNPNLKKIASNQTVGGFKCDEYAGSGNSQMGQYSVKGCFDSTGPGASEYDHFMSLIAQRLKASAVQTMQRPKGIPIRLETSTKITNFSMPGLSAEQAKAMQEMMRNRPPTKSSVTTTSIKTATLPAETFAIPADYAEAKMPAAMGGPGMMPAPASPKAKPYQGE
jgi:hypothetical protein